MTGSEVRVDDPQSDPEVTYSVAEYGHHDPLLGLRSADCVDLGLDARIFLLNEHDVVLRVIVPDGS